MSAMGEYIKLTTAPVRVTYIAQTYQPEYLALDVSAYDSLELLCVLSETQSSPVVIQIWGAMAPEGDATWTKLGQFPNFTGSNQSWQLQLGAPSTALLRWIRWGIQVGSSNTITFFICGRGTKR